MAWFVVAAALAVVVVVSGAWIARVGFHRAFEARAREARRVAGTHGDAPVTEAEVRELPEPIARWIRWSGALGKPRVSALRLVHGGQFKAAPGRPWMPIRGEYLVTTRRPGFVWYGRMDVAPGLHAAAIDAYVAGEGRMQVKALSAFTVVDARSPAVDASAFGRCVAELSMTPTFFLDRSLVRCEAAGTDHARCHVSDGHHTTTADVYVHPDGALDRIEVQRAFDRGGGRTTLERFTGQMSRPIASDGRRLASRLDGFWNLPEGDLHYVAFEIEAVAYE